MMMSTLCKRFLSLLRAEAGTATVEFTLWVPVLLGIVLIGADASAAFTRQANFWRVSNETARIVSRHAMDPQDGAAFARNQLRLGDHVPEVSVVVDEAAQLVTVSITTDAGQLAPMGILSFALGGSVSFTITQALEPI